MKRALAVLVLGANAACSPVEPLGELRPLPPSPFAPPFRAEIERVWQLPEVTVVGRPPKPHSRPLRNPRVFNPLPGGVLGGWFGDTGLDISASFRPVYAIAAGTLDYSENGHTRWTRGKDTPGSIRLALDEPIPFKGRRVTHVYYTHLSAMEYAQPEGAKVREHVEAGEPIGVTGIGNGVPHLHIGLLLDDQVEQDTWDSLLVEGDIRAVFGGYRNGEVLPRL